jgi:5-methylcytosine-specific restriction endonuclease McrA
MPWLKVSDTAAHHPVVTGPLMEVAPDAVDASDMVNLAFGLVVRCATHSAGFLTDYLISDSTVALMGGANWLQRAQLAERVGYWRRAEGGWLIIDDPENFLHIRLKEELSWERQRRRDTSDAALIVPVRLRDGDACRYCGLIVNWRDRKSGRGGTYDHRVPGKAATGPDDLRVACTSCNKSRSNAPDADVRRPLRPAPPQPYYGSETVALLASSGIHVPLSTPTRPGNPPDTASAQRDLATGDDTAPTATRHPAGHRTADPRPGTQPDTARDSATVPNTATPRDPATVPATATPRDLAARLTPRTKINQADLTDPADPTYAVFGSPGRGGTGRVSDHPNSAPSAGRRRGRRGRSN